MRTLLNKALTPENNKVRPYSATANKALTGAADAAAAIEKADPENRAQLLKGIADAQAAQKAAAQAKEDAETEADFNRACDNENHARDKEAFYKRQLDCLDYTPRMDESVYYGHVAAVEAAVSAAAADFRQTAEKAIKTIVAAQESYLKIIAEADEALTALDVAANVLQCKYRYKETTYNGGAVTREEDPHEWMRHAIRYRNTGRGHDLIARNDAGTGWNAVACAAWSAAERAKKGLNR